MTTARGIRNRNPGNIVVSGWTQRQNGYTGPEPQGRFATFDTMAHGVEALIRLLLVYRDQHKLTTIRQIINRWAPPTENDTGSYVLSVGKMLGVGIDDELPADPHLYARLARAIVAHENGRDAAAAVTDEDYDQAMVAAFMLPSQAAGSTAGPVVSPAPPPAAAPPAPSIIDRARGAMSPLLIPAITAVIDAVPSLMRIFKGDSKTVERNAKAVEVIGGIIKEATGEETVAGAAEKVIANPEAAARVEKIVQERYYELAEAGGGGIEGARNWIDRMTTGSDWRAIGAGLLMGFLSILILGGGGWIFYKVLFHDGTTPEQKGMLVGALVAFLSSVVSFWFGSSAQSRSKDRTIEEQARR